MNDHHVPRQHQPRFYYAFRFVFVLTIACVLLTGVLAGRHVQAQEQPLALPSTVSGSTASTSTSKALVSVAQKFTSPGANPANDNFGRGVLINYEGNTAFIGATGHEIGGMVFVYNRNPVTRVWELSQNLTSDITEDDDEFAKTFAFSDDGNTVLVGEVLDNYLDIINTGSAHFFTRTAGTWARTQKVVASDYGLNYQFGRVVAISGDGTRALIGAPGYPGGTAYRGRVYQFSYDSLADTWTETDSFTPAGAGDGDRFGGALAMNTAGDTVIVGAVDDNNKQGSAYVFVRSGDTWTQQAQFAGEVTGDEFSNVVAISRDGNTAVVGAVAHNATTGAVYVYTRSGVTWTLQAKLTPSGSEAEDFFGSSVSLNGDGDLLLAGASGRDKQGAAFLFARSGSTWTEIHQFQPDDLGDRDRFGHFLALSPQENTALIGAYDQDVNGAVNAGAAYSFDFFTTCNDVIVISTEECNALVALYDGTGGAAWSNAANWRATNNPCTWYGVSCAGSVVTGVSLSSNNLVGGIPAGFLAPGGLTSLQTLDLSLNSLTGGVSAGFGNLTSLNLLDLSGNALSSDVEMDFSTLAGLNALDVGYNALTATNPDVIAGLNAEDPDWDDTQTVAPSPVTLEFYNVTQGLRAFWTPISYTSDGGQYSVTCSNGSTQATLNTTDKLVSEAIFNGLPDGTYTCTVSTFTPEHGQNPNALTSDTSTSNTLAYSGPDAPINDLFANPIVLANFPKQDYSFNIAKATSGGDPLPPVGDPNCPVVLEAGSDGIHYEVPGTAGGLIGKAVIRSGGPGWYKGRNPSAADTAIVVYEVGAGGALTVVKCDDDNAPGEISVSDVVVDLDPTKTYRVVVWNEGAAAEGAVIEIAAATFNLTAPADNFRYDPNTKPAEFKWQAFDDPNLLTYSFTIGNANPGGAFSVLRIVELTPDGADSDGLSCDATECTLTVAAVERLSNYLTTASYIWSVSAKVLDPLPGDAENTSLRDSNQIYRVVIGEPESRQIAQNFSFEDAAGNPMLVPWTGKNLSGDKVKCNKGDKIVAYHGECAFRFKGEVGKNASIEQTIIDGQLMQGDTLGISVWMRGKTDMNTKITVQVKYAFVETTKVKLNIAAFESSTYTQFVREPVVLNAGVTQMRLRVKYTSTSGKLWVDQVALTVNPETTSAVAPGGADAALPLPAADSAEVGVPGANGRQ